MFKFTTLGLLPMILFFHFYGWSLASFGVFVLLSGLVQLVRDIVLTAVNYRKVS